MKTFLLLICLFTFCTLSGADSIEVWRNLSTVAKKSPENLLKIIRDKDISPPLIHSKWYIDERIAKEFPDTVGNENAKREFGHAWLLQLEEESQTLRALTTNEEREAKARTLLDLADWIGSKGGYGNLWLFYRLQDLANIPIGYLLSDNDYPMSSLEQIVPRLRNYIEIFTMIGISALNSEALEPIFEIGTIKPDLKYGPPRSKSERAHDIQTPSFQVWQKKISEATKQLKQTQKKDENIGDLTGAEKRNRLPKSLQFFIDDNNDKSFNERPFTVLEHWNDKFHYKLLLGLVGNNIKYSFALLEFRKKVGNVPEPYVFTPEEIAQGEKIKEESAKKGGKVVLFWDNPNFDAQEFAFRKAWWALSDIPEGNRNMYLDAFRLIKLVREKKLWDDDYQKKLLYNEKNEWSIHVKEQRQKRLEREKQDKNDPLYLRYITTQKALEDSIADTNHLEEKIVKLMDTSGVSISGRYPLDVEYLFLLRDEKYNEADAYFEKRKRNACRNLLNKEAITQLEELLFQESNAIKKQVEMEQVFSKVEKEYKMHKEKLYKQRKLEDQKETELFLKTLKKN